MVLASPIAAAAPVDIDMRSDAGTDAERRDAA
jgi:hypothetical protein